MVITHNPYDWEIRPRKILEKSSETIKEERNEIIEDLNANKDNLSFVLIDMYAKAIVDKNVEYMEKYIKEHFEEAMEIDEHICCNKPDL